MRLIQRLGVLLAVSAFSEAFVEFDHSRLYDEMDFEKTWTNYIPDYCDEGCLIYVSVPDNSFQVARHIYIYDGSAPRTRITNANTKDTNGRLVPYQVKKGSSQVDFINDNIVLKNDKKSAPLLIWIIRSNFADIDNVEVYDADNSFRMPAPGGFITILDAEPFVVTTDTYGPMTVSAHASGFDTIANGIDTCKRVLGMFDPLLYQDFHISVRSPLITFVFNDIAYPDTLVALHASKQDVPSFDLGKPMFVTSPGYIGCSVNMHQHVEPSYGVRHKTYRSSLYDNATEFQFESDAMMNFLLTSDLNVDDDHTVEIKIDNEASMTWSGIGTAPSMDGHGKKLRISWARDEDGLDRYFLIRINPDSVVNAATVMPSTMEDRTTRNIGLNRIYVFRGYHRVNPCANIDINWNYHSETSQDYHNCANDK